MVAASEHVFCCKLLAHLLRFGRCWGDVRHQLLSIGVSHTADFLCCVSYGVVTCFKTWTFNFIAYWRCDIRRLPGIAHDILCLRIYRRFVTRCVCASGERYMIVKRVESWISPVCARFTALLDIIRMSHFPAFLHACLHSQWVWSKIWTVITKWPNAGRSSSLMITSIHSASQPYKA